MLDQLVWINIQTFITIVQMSISLKNIISERGYTV